MKETRITLDAFELYFTLIDSGMNLSKAIGVLAEKYDRAKSTIWRWYSDLNWDNRYYERMMKVQRRIESQKIKSLAENKQIYLSIIQKIINDFISQGKEKGKLPIKIRTTTDLDKIIKLALLLQESPTSVIENLNEEVSTTKENLFDEKLMKKILEEEGDLIIGLQKQIQQ